MKKEPPVLSNRLCYGDCLTIIQEIPPASIDLIYLDPPFNSARNYNAIYKTETGQPLPDQIEAFCDTWQLDEERERAVRNMPVLMRENGIDDDLVEFWQLWMRALCRTNPALLAYLSYMTERLLPMKAILKPTGSIYLHCDPTASHYIKIMLDVIFGHKNFRNEIIWSYRTGGASKRYFSRKHDILLFYTVGKKYTYNNLKEKAYTQSKSRKAGIVNYGAGTAEFFEDEYGVYNRVNMRDVWEISYLNSQAKERLGYATQKPIALLERIIKASTNEGDVVFDPFCGCATTIEAAHHLGRKWIGIDIAIHAIKRVSQARLKDRLGLTEGTDYTIEGVPQNFEGAHDLWERDKYHFQQWAVEQVNGFVTAKRTRDGGIDGRLYFNHHDKPDLSSMVLEVKGGKKISINDLRALRTVLDTDTATMAGLIVLHPLGERQMQNFREFMAQAGDLDEKGVPYARMQILTVDEILEGKRFMTPSPRGHRLSQPTLPLG